MSPDKLTAASDRKSELSYEAILFTLFENYESIYDIDAETSAYQCYHESESYKELKIKSAGVDFFKELAAYVPRVIHPEDCGYVLKKLDRETLLAALKREKYYSFVYRLLFDDKPVYHKVRATLSNEGGKLHILLGVRDVDETIRQEKAHTEALASMYQKEKNHMEAILASAAGYLEVNLTRDLVLEQSPYLPSGKKASAPVAAPYEGTLRYSDLNQWICESQITENLSKYAAISDRAHLLECFARGERRASVSFSARRSAGGEQPCREVFFLYQDHPSGDIMSFCVIYDLTQEQRREKEMTELENALQMSRIQNSASQMQPHFLYNALGSIQEIVLVDPEYASDLLGDFTIHLRSCIRAMADDRPIPFAQEIANIKAYVHIEQMRFGEKLRVEYDLAATDFAILPLSVQPLVENAIRHGIYHRGPQGGTVTITSGQTEENWFVEVRDDGVGFDTETIKKSVEAGKKDSTGLKNLIFRLEQVMHASVTVQSVPGQGTSVKIRLPKTVNNPA